jgi:uncharacterized protein (UPF0332 family)
MAEYIEDLSRYRLSKAKDDLESSKLLLENNHIKQSLNRSYYAIFHATRALLAYNIFDSKKHTGIISYFNLHYIKTKKIDYVFFKILTKAELIRHDSDYDDFFRLRKNRRKNN